MPGLTLHSGNDLERLAGRLADIIRKGSLSNPFEPETILVQSRGMQRWVSMRLAERLGVLANCTFPFPNEFIHGIFEGVLGTGPDPSYSPEQLCFVIMGIIESMKEEPALAAINRYILGDMSGIKLVQLSRHIADLFDQYIVFRPEYVLGWDKGKRFFSSGAEAVAEEWQALIFNRVAAELGANAARIRQDFFTKLKSGKPAGLPGRVSVFGISHLPLFHMEVLRELGRFVDVHLFLLNPCREYWMDIESEKGIIRKSGKSLRSPDTMHLETGNSLLASMGRQGADFLGMLYGIDEIITDEDGLWVPSPEDTVLAKIKSDILELRNGPLEEKYLIGPDDRSLVVASCHSPMREVEVLRDALLEMFEDDPSIRPEEIVVMSPDINKYAPYIEAVFGGSAGKKTFIPFSISDRPQLGKDAADGFFSLLALSDRRFKASCVMSILDEKAVRCRFGLGDDDLSVIRQWVDDACIRWGRDADGRESLGLGANDANTWRAGLDRLLLGYAMPGDTLFKGILAMDGIEGGRAEVLGKFLSFIEKAFEYGTMLSESRSLQGWSELLLKMIEDMLDADADVSGTVLLKNAVAGIASFKGYSGELGIQAVRHLIKASTGAPSAGSFLSRGVTFCSMLPMRSIPMKALCMIGMNGDAYPRQNITTGFNLISSSPRKGDRSFRDDDRYLFLEAVISARSRLYISYVGQDIRDNSIRPPSVLVSELLDYIRSNFVLDGQGSGSPEDRDRAIMDRFVVRHALQGFSPKYFTGDDERLFSYSASYCDTAKRLQQASRGSEKPFVAGPIKSSSEIPDSLAPETLTEFFDGPVRFFLRRRLGITLRGGSDEIRDREIIDADSLEKYYIRQQIADCIMAGREPLPLIQARGILPHSSVGVVLYQELFSQMQEFMTVLRRLAGDGNGLKVSFEAICGKTALSGDFRLFGGDLLFWRPADISARHMIRAWLWHVLLNCSGKGSTTRLVGFEKKGNAKAPSVIRFEPPDNPEAVLEKILGMFIDGQETPLHFFPGLSMSYAKSVLNPESKKTEDEILSGIIRDWEGDGYSDGEGKSDPYYMIYPDRICPIDDNFKRASTAFFDDLLKSFGKEK